VADLGGLRLDTPSSVPSTSVVAVLPSEEKPATVPSSSSRSARMHYRWSPYHRERRSKSSPVRGERQRDASYFSKLAAIRLKGDVDGLRMCILDSPRGVGGLSCSMEASRPPLEDAHIDELAEYFEHFVTVQFKMSELAQSMYV